MKQVVTRNEEETQKLACGWAKEWQTGGIVTLQGSLGAGKTQFAKGVAQALGISEPITSPTYAIIQEYQGHIPFIHMDLYRLRGEPEDFENTGAMEYLRPGILCLIEWPQKSGIMLPSHWEVVILIQEDQSRKITCQRIESP